MSEVSLNQPNTRLSIQLPTDLIQENTGNFNGQFPDGALSGNGSGQALIWATGINQGMIYPLAMGITETLRIVRIQLTMAGQATYSVNLIDTTTNTTYVLNSGTTASTYTAEALGFLSYGQQLQVVTTGGGTTSVKMIATLSNPSMCPISLV